MRALFFGTPDFATPSLDALAEVAEVAGVVCQPDKPKGRGLALAPPPVKVRATERGFPVVQPTKLKTGDFAAWVLAQRADVALVVAYGRILPRAVLDGPRLGMVNVHASLLPRYRGAAPVTWAVVRGETESGVTLMLLDEGMDTGDMLVRSSVPIGADETAGELSATLAQLGAKLVREELPRFVRGELTRTPQDPAAATLAPLLSKEDGRIDWSRTAKEVHDKVRGMSPWPGASTTQKDRVVKVHRSERISFPTKAPAGTVVLADKARVIVACGDGEGLALLRIQLEGKKPISAPEWVAGRGVAEGDRLV